MILYSISFYLFSGIAVLSALMVISSKNPVHSVLFLILSFINASALFVLLGAEFLAMIIVVVYVGAVAVLFLFVVMMLDITQEERKNKLQKYTPFTLILVVIVCVELLYVFISDDDHLSTISTSKNLSFNNNTVELGNLIYTDYALLFQLSGIILLVAMIGAIVLTLRGRTNLKKQIIKNQVEIKKSDVIEIVNVKNREGA